MRTKTLSPPFTRAELTSLSNDIRLACMRISRRVRYESTDLIAPHHFSVMCRLEESPRTPGELAEIERVSAPSMTRTVAGLVELGYVERTPGTTDKRQVFVALTDEARKVLKETRRKRDAWMSVRVGHLTPEEQEVLLQASAILTRVANE